MKKVFLTLTLSLFIFGASKTVDANNSTAKVLCLYYTNEDCGFTAVVCGSTFNEMSEQADIWDDLLC